MVPTPTYPCCRAWKPGLCGAPSWSSCFQAAEPKPPPSTSLHKQKIITRANSHWKIDQDISSLTNLLVLWNTHDLKGFHGLCEQILVLLPRDRDISIGKESVVVVIFEEEILCDKSQREVKLFAQYIHINDPWKTFNKALTSQSLSCSCEQVVENMERPLLFGLANGTGFLQQV